MTTVALATPAASAVEHCRLPADSPEIAAAQRLLAGADLLVDVDLVVRRRAGAARLRARHALRGTAVHGLATVGTTEVEVVRCDVTDWQAELARSCQVSVPTDAPTPPAAGLALPWDLALGTGAAHDRRPDLYDVLVARGRGSVSVDGRALGPAATREQVGRLHRSVVGRLRCVGTVPGRRAVGWTSWLLFGGGWRALTPYAAAEPGGPRAMLRLDPREPRDLGADVARWAAEVPR